MGSCEGGGPFQPTTMTKRREDDAVAAPKLESVLMILGYCGAGEEEDCKGLCQGGSQRANRLRKWAVGVTEKERDMFMTTKMRCNRIPKKGGCRWCWLWLVAVGTSPFLIVAKGWSESVSLMPADTSE